MKFGEARSFTSIAARVLAKPVRLRSTTDSGFTRRDFLVGGTAAGIAFGVNDAVGADLYVTSTRQTFSVSHLGREWSLERGALGAAARVRHRWNDAHLECRIDIDDALWPGTSLKCDLQIVLRKARGTWTVAIRWEGQRSSFEMPLGEWLMRVPSRPAALPQLKEILLGRRGRLIFRREPSWSLDSDWNWRIASRQAELQGLQPGRVIDVDTILVTSVPSESVEVAELARGIVPAFVTRLRLSASAKRENTLVAWQGGNGIDSELRVETFDVFALTPQRAVVRADGEGAVQISCSNEVPPRILLERVVVAGAFGSDQPDIGIAAYVARRAQNMDTGSGTVAFAGLAEHPLTLSLNGNSSNLKFTASLYGATLPIGGADLAELQFDLLPVEISIGEESGVADFGRVFPGPGKPSAPPRIAFRQLSSNRAAADLRLPLDGCRLHLLRSRDLLNVCFGFRYVSLAVLDGSARFVAHHTVADVARGVDPSLLIVHFPPQHIVEEAFEDHTAGGWEDLPPKGRDAHKPIAEARLAAPTRLVFDLKLKPGDRIFPFTAAELTRWANYGLVVTRRAMPADVGLNKQLDAIGIKEWTTRGQAFKKVIQSLVAPTDSETSIELPYRLILSPSSRARWITSDAPAMPRGTPAIGTFPLWHARIDAKGPAPDVRAVWSRGLNEGFQQTLHLAGDDDVDTAPWAPDDPTYKFQASMNPRHRREIMFLSSIFGLPALRRRVCANPDDLSTCVDDEHGQVVPAPPGYAFIAEGRQADEGLFIPRPMINAAITLTSIGGVLQTEQRWEPPAPAPGESDLNWRPAIRLQRFLYRGIPARDIRVEIEDKGFLFPLGHRAALLQITERKFLDRAQNASGPKRGQGPTAYLLQRRFIVVDKPEKTFPALNQPFDGRPFPARKITLVTRATPPLVDPKKPEGGKIAVAENPEFVEGSAFWPKRQMAAPQTPGVYPDVIWEYRVDDSPDVARSRLLFVGNDMAHSATDIEGLVAAYNKTVAVDIDVPRERSAADRIANKIPRFVDVNDDDRRVNHNGARRAYGESTKPGDTTFETKNWLLAATGRKIGANVPGAARFTMDAYMEGADQPAFYPVLDRAFLRVQPLERFLGRPDTTVETRVSRIFIEQAFATNPSEAFLDVIAPPVFLDLNSNGTSSGGVAKPNSRVVALSRSHGLIGGNPPAQEYAVRALSGAATSPPQPLTPPPWQQGSFNPADFFSDAKLLGLISLKDVIHAALFEAAPKLVETVETAVDDTIAPRLREAAALLIKALAPVLAGLSNEVVAGAPTAAELYPGLNTKLGKLLRAAERLNQGLADTPADGTTQQAINLASDVYRAIQEALAEIEAVAANPIPALAGDIIHQMLEALEVLKRLIAARGEAAIRRWIETNVRDRVLAVLEQLCANLHSSSQGVQLMQLLFGKSAASDDICKDVRWLLDIEPQVIRQRLEAEAGRRLEDISQAACTELLLKPQVNAILKELLTDDELNGACEGPGGLAAPLTQALPRAARRYIDARMQALADTLFYEVFGRSFVNIVSKVRHALAEIEDAAGRGHEHLARVIFQLIDDVTQIALESGILADITQAVQAIFGLCDRVLTRVESLARDTMASLSELQGITAGIDMELATAEREVARLPEAQRTEAERMLRSVREALAAFNTRLAELEVQRQRLPTSASVCRDVADQLDLVARVLDLRRDTVVAAQDLLGRVGEVVDVLAIEQRLAPAPAAAVADQAKVARDAIGAVGVAVLTLIREVTAMDSFAGSKRPQSVADLRTLVTEMKTHAGVLRQAAEEVEKAVDAARDEALKLQQEFMRVTQIWTNAIAAGKRDPKVLRALAESVVAYAAEHDRRVAGLVARGVALQAEVRERLERFASDLLAEVFNATAAIYLPTATAVQQLMDLLLNSSSSSAAYIKKALRPSVVDVMTADYNELRQDRARIDSVQALARSATAADRAQARRDAKDLLERWRKQQPAIVRTARDFAQLGELLLRGRFDALIDIDSLRRELEQAALSFVPTTARLAYDFRTDIKEIKGLFKIIDPRPGQDLVLSTTVEVDLLRGKRTVRASGRLRPFQVTLIPSFEAIQIDCSEATFESIDGSAPRFDIKVSKVAFLQRMKFVESLASWLSGGGKSGLYYDIDLARLQLEVGYRFPASVINLGYFQVLNIGFSLAAILPLGNSEALFKIAVSSRDAPFLIVAPPYGGGGFVALTANAKRIKVVEASFEFGAVMPINFGPLKGHGRVTAGIYFRSSDDGSSVLEGFVQAIGEGSVACFTICVRLEVRMIQSGSNATGTASFQFTFKVGFAEISYGVTATYNYEGGGSAALISSESSFAAIDSVSEEADGQTTFAAAPPGHDTRARRRRTRVRIPRRDTEWRAYRKQYSHLEDMV